MAANFDRVARSYRWLEYFSFGPILERCRFYRLRQISACSRALVIGDGDGRFLARLMRENPLLTVEAIDSSREMLKLLKDRVEGLGAAGRLTLRCEDARNLTLSGQYDLVTTHFFLDCLSTEEIAALASRIRPHLSANVVWVVSDFAIPDGGAALPSQIVVSSLYAAFGILTGLKTRSLPRHGEALRSAGFVLADRKEWLGGLLFSELWKFEATDQLRILSH